MTDTRLPEYYLTSPALDALDDGAFRVFINGLMWSVTHGTDGALSARSVRFLHPDQTVVRAAAKTLVACGLWERGDQAYLIVGFLRHQTPAAQIEDARERDRRRKQRDRAHERGDHSLCNPDRCPDASARTSARTSERTSEDRTGEAPKGSNHAGTSRADCFECQRRRVFGSGACPDHREAVA